MLARTARRWQQLLRRDARGLPHPRGQIYAAPCKWGASVVAVRQDKLRAAGARAVADWADLLQPQLRGRVAFVDSPHEFVGMALKSLGLPFSCTAAQLAAAGMTEARLQQRVHAFWSQAKLFSSRDHVRALQAGDVWAVVGWSTDLINVAERTRHVSVVAPASGTALWADLWVAPSGAKGGSMQSGPSPLLPSWLEFTLQPGRIASLPGLKTGASPLLLPDGALPPAATAAAAPSVVAAAVRDGRASRRGSSGSSRAPAPLPAPAAAVPLPPPQAHNLSSEEEATLHSASYYMPPPAVLARSEFLLPLDDDTTALYARALLAASSPPPSLQQQQR